MELYWTVCAQKGGFINHSTSQSIQKEHPEGCPWFWCKYWLPGAAAAVGTVSLYLLRGPSHPFYGSLEWASEEFNWEIFKSPWGGFHSQPKSKIIQPAREFRPYSCWLRQGAEIPLWLFTKVLTKHLINTVLLHIRLMLGLLLPRSSADAADWI